MRRQIKTCFVTAIYNPAGIPHPQVNIYIDNTHTQVSLLLLNVGFQGGPGVVLLGWVFVAHFDSDLVRPGWWAKSNLKRRTI